MFNLVYKAQLRKFLVREFCLGFAWCYVFSFIYGDNFTGFLPFGVYIGQFVVTFMLQLHDGLKRFVLMFSLSALLVSRSEAVLFLFSRRKIIMFKCYRCFYYNMVSAVKDIVETVIMSELNLAVLVQHISCILVLDVRKFKLFEKNLKNSICSSSCSSPSELSKLSHSVVGKLMSPQTILCFFGNFSSIF